MLVELILTLSLFAVILGFSYPSISAFKDSIDERAEILKVVKQHSSNVQKAIKADRPIKLNNVTYYPNLTNRPTIIKTRKHRIILGKYNSVRIERKKY